MLDTNLKTESLGKETEENQMGLKNTITKASGGLTSRMEGTEERISELGDRTIKNTQPEQEKNCHGLTWVPPSPNVTVFRDGAFRK